MHILQDTLKFLRNTIPVTKRTKLDMERTGSVALREEEKRGPGSPGGHVGIT
jgi:hypothetical protein